MITFRSSTYRLYPSEQQAQQMAQISGCCRFVYNLALEQRRDFWRQFRRITGRPISFASQCRELTELRATTDWIKAAPSHVLQQALRDLDRAYQNWWQGYAKHPTPRKKGINESFRFPDSAWIRIERTGHSSGRVKLLKLGWVKIRGWSQIPGDICSATVSFKAGKWSVSIRWKLERSERATSSLPPVGLDRGIAIFAALSNGIIIPSANYARKASICLMRAQRALARKKKGSANRRKAIRRLATLHRKVANARRDFLHKCSTEIAKNHGVVIVENLKVREMTRSAKGSRMSPGRNVKQKSGLNRSILDQGWSMFRAMLEYKLAERGGHLIEVSPQYTSQACSECGCIDRKNRLTQARFECTGCGHTANADVNAAINILQWGLGKPLKPVEGNRSWRPDEAGSIREAV